MMTLQEFGSAVKREVRGYLPPDYNRADITLAPVTKNNAVAKTGLTIRKEDESICPIIYLEEYYEGYLKGGALSEQLEMVAAGYLEAASRESNLRQTDLISFDFDKAKDYITCRLINQKDNAEFLKGVPHRPVEDLAVTYQLTVINYNDGVGTIKITNEIMRKWGISIEELNDLAIKNASRMYPATLRSMADVILELMKEDGAGENLLQGIDKPRLEQMYVLTNENMLNGASVILYPGVLDRVHQAVCSDYYILPSSIHEIIVIPKGIHSSEKEPEKELGEIVREANSVVVLPEERLSDCVYEYKKSDRTIKQVKGSLSEKEMKQKNIGPNRKGKAR